MPKSIIVKYYYTIKYLKPIQFVNQIKSRLPQGRVKLPEYHGRFINRDIAFHALDYDEGYLKRFDIEKLEMGTVTLLNCPSTIDLKLWHNDDETHLWNFNLHYLEYCIPLAVEYNITKDEKYWEMFSNIITNWINYNPIGIGDAWHPYTISMRIPNLLIAINIFGKKISQDKQFEMSLKTSLYNQYRYLIEKLELRQLGNHFFENLKCITMCSLVFDEKEVYEKFSEKLIHEIKEEILPDGMHFELSPMYHLIILEDLLRLAKCTEGKQIYNDIREAIQKMVNAGHFLCKGFNRIPLFNDSGDNVSKSIDALIDACKELGIEVREIDFLDYAGYYRIEDNDTVLLMDIGNIGPSYMPGHGQCDCLSFELSIGGKPVFVNGGTGSYQGEDRDYYRSTRAHNTLTIGGREQSECWGEHRVARRISNIHAEQSSNTIIGSFKSQYGDTHQRVIKLEPESISISDTVKARYNVPIKSYLHLGVGFDAKNTDNGIMVCEGKSHIKILIKCNNCAANIVCDGELTKHAPEFGKEFHTKCIVFKWNSDDESHGYTISTFL